MATLLCCLDALVLHRTVLNYFLSPSAAFTKLLAQLYRKVMETNNMVQPKVFVAILRVCHTLLSVDNSLFPLRYSKSYSGPYLFVIVVAVMDHKLTLSLPRSTLFLSISQNSDKGLA